MLSLVLKQAVEGVVSAIGVGVHPTQANSVYTLTVAGSDSIPDGLELLRDGDDLVMTINGDEVSRLTEFYSDDMAAQFSVNGSLDTATAEIGTSTVMELEGAGTVWPESDLLGGLAETEAFGGLTATNVAAGVLVVGGGVALANDDSAGTGPAPTVVISGGTSTPVNGDVTFTIVFDNDVQDFVVDDVVVTGGTKGAFTAVSASEYTLVVTPSDDSVAPITVDIAADVARTSAGGKNLAAEQETQAVDTLVATPTAVLADAGSSGLTNDATVNVGALEAGASWEYSVDSGSSWVAGSGSSFELGDDSYDEGYVQVRQTDLAGNLSNVAELGAIEVDTTVAPPTVDIASDSNIGDDRITNDATIVVDGLESGASWEYSVDSGSTWSSGGSDSSFELADGVYDTGDVQVRQTDLAGNQSLATDLAGATVDTAITTPTAVLADAGSSGLTNDATVNVGALEAGASWEYSVDSGSSWVAGSGSSFELGDDSYDEGYVQVRQTDLAGNLSNVAELGAIEVDTTVASLTVDIASDSNIGDDRITNDATIVVDGLESGASWEYSVDSGSTWSSGGSDSSFELADGVYDTGDVQVRQTDLAGNQSLATDLAGATVDTAITTPTVALADAGSSGLTNDATVNVGALEAGASWEYSVDSGSTWSSGGSDSSFELADGVYDSDDVLVRQTDLAGNLSSNGALAAATIDTAAPAAPSVALVDAGTDGSTSDATVTISGLEADAIWEYSTDGGNSWNPGSGNSFELADGVYDSDDVLVRQTDLAGNLSSNGALAAATIDTVAPAEAIPVIFDFANGHTSTLDGTPTGSRVFSGSDSYDIYIIVPYKSGGLQDLASELWTGTLNLGSDDKLILVGDANSTVESFTVASYVYFSSSYRATRTNYDGGYEWMDSGGRQAGLFRDTIGRAILYRTPNSSTNLFGALMLSGYNSGTSGTLVGRANMGYLGFTTEGVAPLLQVNLGGISMTWNGTRLTV